MSLWEGAKALRPLAVRKRRVRAPLQGPTLGGVANGPPKGHGARGVHRGGDEDARGARWEIVEASCVSDVASVWVLMVGQVIVGLPVGMTDG